MHIYPILLSLQIHWNNMELRIMQAQENNTWHVETVQTHHHQQHKYKHTKQLLQTMHESHWRKRKCHICQPGGLGWFAGRVQAVQGLALCLGSTALPEVAELHTRPMEVQRGIQDVSPVLHHSL